jgi:hypothetical protein
MRRRAQPNLTDKTTKQSADVVVAGARPGALARLDVAMVEAVSRTAEQAYRSPGMLLPASTQFAEQLDMVLAAAKADMATGADQAAIRGFLTLFAERRNLPVPSSLALDLDAATMAQWPQDLFAKAAHAVWERFEDMRVANPPDFLAFIDDELGERRRQVAAMPNVSSQLTAEITTTSNCVVTVCPPVNIVLPAIARSARGAMWPELRPPRNAQTDPRTIDVHCLST